MPLCQPNPECPIRIQFYEKLNHLNNHSFIHKRAIKRSKTAQEYLLQYRLQLYRTLWHKCKCCTCRRTPECHPCMDEKRMIQMTLLLRCIRSYINTPGDEQPYKEEKRQIFLQCVHYRLRQHRYAQENQVQQ